MDELMMMRMRMWRIIDARNDWRLRLWRWRLRVKVRRSVGSNRLRLSEVLMLMRMLCKHTNRWCSFECGLWLKEACCAGQVNVWHMCACCHCHVVVVGRFGIYDIANRIAAIRVRDHCVVTVWLFLADRFLDIVLSTGFVSGRLF